MKRVFSIFIILPLCFVCSSVCAGGEFKMFSSDSRADIVVAASEENFVKLAADDLASDAEKVCGKIFSVLSNCEKNATLYIGTLGNAEFEKILKALNVDAKLIRGKSESFILKNVGKDFVIVGSEPRGTMFGVYEFCEKYLGVDPLYYFSDLKPKRLDTLVLKNIDFASKEPSSKYRGWFLNDEDLLSEFFDCTGRRNIDYAFYGQVVNPELMAHVVEALVRLKFNLIIPASFLDVKNPPEEALLEQASKRGLYITQHHIEPLGVSGYTFFNYFKQKDGSNHRFSYFSNKDEMIEVWRHYAEDWAKRPNVIWQIGLRGIADKPMWTADDKIPSDDKERGKIISDAIAKQIEIVKEFDKRANPPMTMTLWGEGAYLFEKGHIVVPEELIIVFSDNSPGWRLQPDFYKTERQDARKYGIYYHLQLWGSGPHLAQAIPPERAKKVFEQAYAKKSAHYVILNVGNVREFLIGLDSSAKMLWDFDSVSSDGGLEKWCKIRFGENFASVLNVYQKYFDSFSIQKGSGVPYYLDGLTRQVIRKICGQIVKKSGEENPFLPESSPKKKMTDMEHFTKVALADMHPQSISLEDDIEMAKSQSRNFKKVLLLAEKTEAALSDGEQRKLFRANLLSHANIMSGLSDSTLNVLYARKALLDGDPIECIYGLETFKFSMDTFEKGLFIGSQGKWLHWYRGAKKINARNLHAYVDEAIKAASELAKKLEKQKK